MKKNPNLEGLDNTPTPSLTLNQSVKVTKGKHQGKTGKVYRYHAEGDGGRLTLILPDGKTIYVDKDEINFKFKWVAIDVMMENDERTEFNQLVKETEEGYRRF